jgi:PAS domain S-box-containing protein
MFTDSADLLMAAIESSNNGVTIADAGQADMPLIYVNTAFTRITGYEAPEVLGRNCRFLHADKRQQPGLDVVRQAIAEGTSCHAVLRNFRKDGTPFWNELYMSPVRDASGAVTHFIGVQNDVTRRVEAEERERALRQELEQQNERLRELNETKNQFLGMAVHDLRNPLASIVLSAGTIARGTVGDVNEDQQEVLEWITDSANSMLRLVNDLLDVSTIESGKLNLQTEPVDLSDFLQHAVALHRSRAAEKGIELELVLPEGEPVETSVDPQRFRQVVDNLVSNAIKFCEAGARVDVSLGVEDDSAVIAVADTGPGIPEQEIESLFQPFARTSTTPTGGEQSTGLGLVICRKVVEAHGGEISVTSQVGHGTTFTVTLPLAGPAA